MSITTKLLAATASLGLASATIPAAHAQSAPIKSIVLVHGGFVDGSGWEGVYKILKKDGYKVSIVQNPTATLADDVAVTRRAIAAADGNVILVGHSYGGVVVTEAGTDPKVWSTSRHSRPTRVNRSASSPILRPGAPVPPILPPQDGFLSLDRAKFAASFAADVKPDVAAFMADSQVPWGVAALNGEVTVPAWKSKPSWYLVATNDKMIPVDAQRIMAKRAGAKTVDQAGSHAIYVSQPQAVAAVIEQAAKGASEGKK
ncbi:MAG: alpha/beta hydrolase, partial [Rhizobium sp.]|nr:alpha/beta hydrolase [Rhizobium sp.]